MRIRIRLLTAVVAVLAGPVFGLTSTAAWAQAREEGRLLMAAQVLNELRTTKDQYIPDRLLERAYAIAVIPDVTKIAFFAGGRHGNGVMVVRDKDGRFSNPTFISMTGGSFGWQWGVQSIDIVLVFTTRKGVEGITGGKFTLGADASVAAGPVGRQASAATDATFHSEVYSYSRTRGVFAGLALDGTALTIDDDADQAFYHQRNVTASDIVSGVVRTDDDTAKKFLTAINAGTQTTSMTQTASAAPIGDSSTNGPRSDAPMPAHAAPTGAQSFPLADPHPGQEPPH